MRSFLACVGAALLLPAVAGSMPAEPATNAPPPPDLPDFEGRSPPARPGGSDVPMDVYAASDAEWRARTAADSMEREASLAEEPGAGRYVWRGFNTRQQVDMTEWEIRHSLDEILVRKANVHRLLVYWADVQPNGRDEWRWAKYDRVVDAAEARGMYLILTPTGSPNWARHPDRRNSSPWHRPDDLDAWGVFVRRLAERYRAYGFEIWNEPNLVFFWGGSPSPGGWAALYCRAAREIKATAPDAWVGGPGLAAVPVEAASVAGNANWSASKFLQRAFEYEISACGLDFVGYHAYAIAAYCDGKNPPMDASLPPFHELRRLRGVMKASGYGKRPVWNTEWGFPSHTCGYTEERQEDLAMLEEAYLASLPYVMFSIWFNLRDDDSCRDARAEPKTRLYGCMGLLRLDWSRKSGFGPLGSRYG